MSKKIVKQICRLSEKQYRKGFQQGYNSFKNGLITSKDVDLFREKGSKENYCRVIDPITQKKYDAVEKLMSEMAMSDMVELINLFLDSRKW